MSNGVFPFYDPAVEYSEFKLLRKCEKCKTGEADTDTPAAATYSYQYDHIRRTCATCGFMWWERPKGG